MTGETLQKYEVFHLAFLRALLRGMPGDTLALKGGSNLRFFFGSVRYSEDMDLDIRKVPDHILQEKVMTLLRSRTLLDVLGTYGITQIVPPDLRYAKQTATVQRFKIHLRTEGGEDLLTKVEFSRRGFDGSVRTDAVSAPLLAAYRMPPLIAPHYTAESAIKQKIKALSSRAEPQARDIFDLYVLSTHLETHDSGVWKVRKDLVREARERVMAMEHEQFRDTVVTFLSADDRPAFDAPAIWDEIRLTVISLLERGATTS